MRWISLCAMPLLVGLTVTGIASSQEKEGSDKAKEHFLQGVALYADGNYSASLVEFKASYKANGNFKVLYNIGLTLQALHRYVEAEDALGKYLLEGADKVPQDRLVEVTQIIAELRGVIGFIDLTCNVEGASVIVDGKDKATTPLDKPLKLNVGSYTVTVEKQGYSSFETSVDIPGKETVEMEATLESTQSARKKPVPGVAFWATAAGAVALGIGAIITGALASAKHKDFLATPREESSTWSSLRSEGKNLALATDILLGVTGAAVVAAVVMAFFTDFGFKKKETALLPSIVQGGMMLSLTGSFRGVMP